MMRISIVGTGYVGLVTGACLADIGHEVCCVDVDPGKVERINSRTSPIYEAGLEVLLQRQVGSRLTATTDLHAAVNCSDLTFITVGSPFDGKHIDLTYVRQVASDIGEALREKSEYHVVVVKSTVVPGTTDDVVRPLLEKASGKSAGNDFGLGMNPEFLTEGTAVADFMEPDRIVIGGIDERTTKMLAEVYNSFTGVPVLRTNNKTAEMIKYTSNAVLATLISFSNEIGNFCSRSGGIDVAEVMRGVHLARYFTMPPKSGDGSQMTAPITSFLYAGCGFGGSCLPKDAKALVACGQSLGLPMSLLETVLEINAKQPDRIIEILEESFASLGGLRVSILGLAFRPDTDDVRESPAIPIICGLLSRGVIVSAYDPAATESARRVLPVGPIRYLDTLESALMGVDATILVTCWDEFQRIPDLLAGIDNPPLVVDGRRALDKGRLARYAGVGL